MAKYLHVFLLIYVIFDIKFVDGTLDGTSASNLTL